MKKIFIALYILVMVLYLSVLLGWREGNTKTGYFLAALWLTLYFKQTMYVSKKIEKKLD